MNPFSLSSIILFFVSLGFGLVVYIGDRKAKANQWWLLVSIATAGWAISLFGITSTSDPDTALLWQYILDVSAILIPLFYLNFILSFLGYSFPKVRYIYAVFSLILIALSFTNDFKIGVTHYQEFFWIKTGPLYILFPVLFLIGVCISLYFLIRELLNKDKADKLKSQIKYILIAGAVGFIGGITNFFPQLFNVYPYGNYFVILYVVLMSYSVLRHQLFNTKVVATQVFIFALWVFLLARLLASVSSKDIVINSILFVATIVVGILLIRSVLKEVKTRERIEKLADELASANARLRELDKQKSEFVSIASHQLRTPLTAMKGYSSMILEGTFGKLPETIKDPIKRIYESSERLVLIIEDFLNISRIEQGRMKYEFSTVDLKKVVEQVLEDFSATFKRKGLQSELVISDKGPFNITADVGKVRQVVSNLIDNSIKYTPKGKVTLTLRKDETSRKVLLTITDTGIGIPAEVIPQLFQKFSRAEDGSKANIQGTGLGLYVAKEIMKAHRGNIWVDSDGKGKGSTFHLEFMAE